jgi:putative N6-adenine-specific DNA methylase
MHLTDSSIYQCLATCLDPFVTQLATELEELGATNLHTHYRAVQFDADQHTLYKIHLASRLASQFYLVIDRIPGNNIKVIQKYVNKIPFDEYFDLKKRSIRIDANQVNRGPGFPSSNDLSKAFRLSLQQIEPELRIELKEPDVLLHVQSFKNHLIVSINTSGKSLHKRGYRVQDHPATLKETFAATLLKEAGYKPGDETLFDPMCGSGTLAIEAALMQQSIPAQWKRSFHDFGLCKLKIFDRHIFEATKKCLLSSSPADTRSPQIIARDIQSDYVAAAAENARAAGLKDHIDFATGDFLHSSPPKTKPGLMISNLPYGQRLKNNDELFKAIGRKIKFDYPGWRFGLLVPNEPSYKQLGFKFDKKIPFKNGGIDVVFLLFSVYDSKKISTISN